MLRTIICKNRRFPPWEQRTTFRPFSRHPNALEKTIMPTIKVSEFAYGRLQSPDLDRAEAFLTEFGMRRAARTKTALYMRGSDAAHHIHLTELGEPRFLSLAFAVADPDDLRPVSTLAGSSCIRSLDARAGRRLVSLAAAASPRRSWVD